MQRWRTRRRFVHWPRCAPENCSFTRATERRNPRLLRQLRRCNRLPLSGISATPTRAAFTSSRICANAAEFRFVPIKSTSTTQHARDAQRSRACPHPRTRGKDAGRRRRARNNARCRKQGTSSRKLEATDTCLVAILQRRRAGFLRSPGPLTKSDASRTRRPALALHDGRPLEVFPRC